VRGRAAALAAIAAGAAACTAAPIDVTQLAPQGLIHDIAAHWSFDEGTGTVLHDDSGDQRDGTLEGPTWTAGQFGGALQFQTGQQVTVTPFSDATPSYSIAAWVRMAATQEPGADYVTLVSTEVPSTEPGAGGWEMNIVPTAGDMRYHFGYYVGPTVNDYDFVECACVEVERWVHLAAVVDAARMALDFYVNGRQVQEATIRHTILPGSSTLYLGSWSQVTPSRFFAGALDDVIIYKRALVREEVAFLAGAPAPHP
jgi:hypothetical protein